MKRGFTLIELLVVVLIIGILSSVALPQYQKAVMKARITEAKTALKAITDATQFYILEHNEVPASINDLSIGVPASNNWTYWYRNCNTKGTKPGCSISATPKKAGLPVGGTETPNYDPSGSLYGLYEAIENDLNISTQENCAKYGGQLKTLGNSKYCAL